MTFDLILPSHQSPVPSHQSPVPNPQSPITNHPLLANLCSTVP
ncbi:hypothetical protein [Sphaerospermopsis sp. FACHB-1094]|nr:hypothetical protein [Sphaerospermopsis sp. FACHB-1094]